MKWIVAVLFLASFTLQTSGQQTKTYTTDTEGQPSIPTTQSKLPNTLLGVVIESWHYDPLTNIVTLKVVNTSHRDITAFNIAIKETYADGRVEQHEMLEEFVGKILAAKQLQGTLQGEAFRKQFGDGAFHPGESRDEIMGVQPGLANYQAVIDVVTYIDGTAEATNNVIDARDAVWASLRLWVDANHDGISQPEELLTRTEPTQMAMCFAIMGLSPGTPITTFMT